MNGMEIMLRSFGIDTAAFQTTIANMAEHFRLYSADMAAMKARMEGVEKSLSLLHRKMDAILMQEPVVQMDSYQHPSIAMLEASKNDQ